MRITISTPLLAAAALALTACGSDATDAEGDADAGTEETAIAETDGEAEATEEVEAGAEADTGKDGAEASAATAEPAGERIDIDFGTDDGDWANDGECDDPRFEGPGMTETTLLEDDIRNDATDCREAFERGELSLRG